MQRWLKDNRGFLLFVLCFGVFRTAVADWNPVPTGSMRPTIVEGDVVLVNRLADDAKLPLTGVSLRRLGDPQRGDVVTFASPKDGTRLIKRIVGVPGDVVAMDGGVLSINGTAAADTDRSAAVEPLGHGIAVAAVRATEQLAGSRRSVQFLSAAGGLAGAAQRGMAPLRVPPDYYFMLGDNRDNRDNREDSRFIGLVPRHAIIGQAQRVLVSADITGNWLPRVERTVSRIR